MHAHSTISELLDGFPVVMIQPVLWGEQDPFGHVNHVTYFRWSETARISYFLKTGLMDLHRTERIGPILASVSNNYRTQVTYPDTVHVGVRVTRIGRSSVGMEHKIISRNELAVAAHGVSTMVVFDYNAGKPHPVPDHIRRDIERIEGRTF